MRRRGIHFYPIKLDWNFVNSLNESLIRLQRLNTELNRGTILALALSHSCPIERSSDITCSLVTFTARTDLEIILVHLLMNPIAVSPGRVLNLILLNSERVQKCKVRNESAIKIASAAAGTTPYTTR